MNACKILGDLQVFERTGGMTKLFAWKAIQKEGKARTNWFSREELDRRVNKCVRHRLRLYAALYGPIPETTGIIYSASSIQGVVQPYTLATTPLLIYDHLLCSRKLRDPVSLLNSRGKSKTCYYSRNKTRPTE